MLRKLFSYLKKFKYQLLAAGVILIIATLVIASITRQKAGPSVVGKDSGVTLVNYYGQTVRFDSFVSILGSKPTIVFFWATWCPYCTAEFKSLLALKQQYPQAQIVAVNRGESKNEAKQYTDALSLPGGITYLLDADDALFKKLGGYAVPETIFINNHGEEVFHKHGPITEAEIQAAMQQLVK